MTANGLLQIALFLVLLFALVKPLGSYMAYVYEGRARFLAPVERLFYRLMGVDPAAPMSWKTYAAAMLLFNLLGLLAVYALQRAQALLPLNPQHLGAVGPELAWNTAVSFATNTNWQGYGGEVTLSAFSQMLGLAVQNFVSAATGMAVLIALMSGCQPSNLRTMTETQAKVEEASKDVAAAIQTALGDKVAAVRATTRLTESPACLVVGEHDMSQHMLRMLEAAGAGEQIPHSKPTLEINPEHLLIQKIAAEANEAQRNDLAELVYEQALLAEGGKLENPAAFVKRMNGLLLALNG